MVSAGRFESLGLSSALSRQLVESHDFITAPTLAQRKLIPAVLGRNDLILRGHTGSGKSFGMLLALMAKPRVVFQVGKEGGKSQNGIASLLLVPSNELADQYISWARALIPHAKGSAIDTVIQRLVRGDTQRTPEEQVEKLLNNSPHILVATPSRALEVLSMPQGPRILGIPTLRSLVIDEADGVLELPAQFPAKRTAWKALSKPPAGMKLLNEVMKLRRTHSGGQPIPSAGFEPSAGKQLDEMVPPEDIRRVQHQANQALREAESSEGHWLAPPKKLEPSERPLQLVACSASANAVMRHFFGAKTGWLRVGARHDEDKPDKRSRLYFGRRGRDDVSKDGQKFSPGQWIDLTGLSGNTNLRSEKERQEIIQALGGRALTMPRELQHACVILDEAIDSTGASAADYTQETSGAATIEATTSTRPRKSRPQSVGTYLPRMRNLSGRRLSQALRPPPVAPITDQKLIKEYADGATVPSKQLPEHQIDVPLLEAAAYTFAAEGATRALAFIPPQWSLKKTAEELEKLGVPVVSVEELRTRDSKGEDPAALQDDEEVLQAVEPKLALIQATSARGLDFPDLSHVFVMGIQAVGDSMRYVHLAGRAARFGPGGVQLAEEKERQRQLAEDAKASSAREDGMEPVANRPAKVAPHILQAEQDGQLRGAGKVVTFLRGLSAKDAERNWKRIIAQSDEAKKQRRSKAKSSGDGGDGAKMTLPTRLLISSEERRMSSIYRRLGVRFVSKVDLRGLGDRLGEAQEDMEEGALEPETLVVESSVGATLSEGQSGKRDVVPETTEVDPSAAESEARLAL